VEELDPSQMKEDITSNLGANTVDVPATSESSVPTKWKVKW
jgi:hypothetical protein